MLVLFLLASAVVTSTPIHVDGLSSYNGAALHAESLPEAHTAIQPIHLAPAIHGAHIHAAPTLLQHAPIAKVIAHEPVVS